MGNEKKQMSFEELSKIIRGNKEIMSKIKSAGRELIFTMKLLNSNEMSEIHNIIFKREISIDNVMVYNDAIRVLKLVYAITKIEMEDCFIDISNKEALEKFLNMLEEANLKSLSLSYETEVNTIYEEFSTLNKILPEDEEKKS